MIENIKYLYVYSKKVLRTDYTEIFGQPVTDEDTTEVDEESQLFVHHLERQKHMRGVAGLKVSI